MTYLSEKRQFSCSSVENGVFIPKMFLLKCLETMLKSIFKIICLDWSMKITEPDRFLNLYK